MTEQKKVSVIRGELTYADKVIEKMIGIALESVDGCWRSVVDFSQT